MSSYSEEDYFANREIEEISNDEEAFEAFIGKFFKEIVKNIYLIDHKKIEDY